MADEFSDVTTPKETMFRLELTQAQLKITHSALKTFMDDFGHEEREIGTLVRQVLDKLPDESVIKEIKLLID